MRTSSNPAWWSSLVLMLAFSSGCSGAVDLEGQGGDGGAAGGGGMGGEGGAPACEPGTEQPCYSGAPGTVQSADCRPGTRVCLPDGSGFGACTGEIFAPDDPCAAGTCQGAGACAVSGNWSHGYESVTGQMGSVGVAVDEAGNIYTSGYLSGETDFGAGPLATNAPSKVFVTKHSPYGELLWARTLGDEPTYWGPSEITIDPEGNLFVLGFVVANQTLVIDGYEIAGGGPAETVLVKMAPDGQVIWATGYGGAGEEFGSRMGVDDDGDVTLVGTYREAMPDPYSEPAETGYFIVKYDAAGGLLWERRIALSYKDEWPSVGVLPWGDAIMSGGFWGEIDFGDGPEVAPSQGSFLARFTSETGELVFSEIYGGDEGHIVVRDVQARGMVVITGYYEGAVQIGETSLFGVGEQPFVASLSPSGGIVWARGLWGTETVGQAYRVRQADDGTVWVGGGFEHLSDLQMGFAGADIFLTKLSTGGTPQWTRVYAGPWSMGLSGFEVRGDWLVLTGSFSNSADFGSGELFATDNHQDMFLATATAY
ncbi:MAG: hypothetical protein R3B70_29470 [Polyangiaceae bacterium]